MSYQKIIKYAQIEEKITFVRGWKDNHGNISVVVDISGKKYAFAKLSNLKNWKYWFGIGSEKLTSEMPAGRGDYLIASDLSSELSDKISSIISSSVNLEVIATAGVTWAPKDDHQKVGLAELINACGRVNQFLSQHGLLYTGNDRNIFGEDITGNMITTVDSAATEASTVRPQVGGQSPSPTTEPAVSVTPTSAIPGGTPESDSGKVSTTDQNDGSRSRSPSSAKKVWKKEDLGKYVGGNINFNLMKDNKNNYRGALKPKYTQLSKEFFESLKTFGIQRIITLNDDDEWDGANLPMLITGAGLQHIYNPIGSVPSEQEFNEIKKYLKMGNNLVHCTHGADRTGAVVGRYYVDEGIMSEEEAIADSIKHGGAKAIAKPQKYAGKGYEVYSDFVTKNPNSKLNEDGFAKRKSSRLKVYKPE